MSEIHFIVEEALEGGYVARAVGADILPRPMTCPACTPRFATQCIATLMKENCPALSACISPVKKCWRHEDAA